MCVLFQKCLETTPKISAYQEDEMVHPHQFDLLFWAGGLSDIFQLRDFIMQLMSTAHL